MPTDRIIGPDLAASGRVSAAVRLTDVALAYTRFQTSPGVDGDFVDALHTEYYAEVVSHDARSMVLAVGFRLGYHPHEHVDGDPGADDAAPSDSEGTSGVDDVDLLEAYADYLLTYEFDPDIPVETEDLDHFARINGVFNAWSYWRARVQSTFAEMGLPKLVVEPFRVPMAAQTHPPAVGTGGTDG